MKNLASKGPSKGPPMKNLVCKEKFGINCASAEAQFGTGRGIKAENSELIEIDLELIKLKAFIGDPISDQIWTDWYFEDSRSRPFREVLLVFQSA